MDTNHVQPSGSSVVPESPDVYRELSLLLRAGCKIEVEPHATELGILLCDVIVHPASHNGEIRHGRRGRFFLAELEDKLGKFLREVREMLALLP